MRHQSPLDHLTSGGRAAGPAAFGPVPAVITDVQWDRTGTQPLMLFTVRPLVAGMPPVLENVPLLLPLFGPPGAVVDPPPTGIVYIPEIGARVRLEPDGAHWLITGCYSGPVLTAMETGLDSEQRRVSYNPGIETAKGRLYGAAGWDLPQWAYGMAPGDVLLGRGYARVKLTAAGLFLGSDLTNCEIFAASGARIRQYVESEDRGMGYWRKLKYRAGVTEARLTQTDRESPPVPGEASQVCEIVDSCPQTTELRPYWVRQRGMIPKAQLTDGRTAMVTDVTSLEVASELESGLFTTDRDTLVLPLTPDPPTLVPDELTSRAATLYDRKVRADGSFRESAGNATRALVTPTVETPALDFDVGYDAVTRVYTIRVGPNGAPQHTFQISPQGLVVRTSAKVDLTAAGEVTIQAPKVSIKASSVRIDGQLEVTGDVKAMGISLRTHKHGNGNDGKPTTPPMQ